MDEQILNNQQQTTPAATPATPIAEAPAAQPTAQQATPLQSGIQAQPAENLPAGVSDYSAQIQQMYDAQLAAKQQSMEDAYNQNLVTMQRAKEQVAPAYFNQGNDLATQYERTRRNNNLQADANGLNTGAGSQMALAQQSNFLDAFGRVRAAQANAERQADQQIADLEVAYKSQVAQALADNDYQKATALLAEYQRRDNAAEEMRRYNYQQQLADAKQRAAYGDFGGFSDLYGADTAKNMQQFWAFNNPDYALAMGMITPDQYQQATGYYPGSSGYSGSSGGGYYRSGGGGYRSSGSGGSSIEGSGVYEGDGGDGGGGTNSLPTMTPEQALRIAAGVQGGSLNSAELESAYQRYRGYGEQAYNAVKSNGVDPNSEAGKAMMDTYMQLVWDDPYVSLDQVQSLQTNRNNNSQIAATTAQAQREAQYGKANEVTYDWNASLPGAQAAAAAASASQYTPNVRGTVSAGTRTPQTTGASPANAAKYAITQNLPALQQLWDDTKAALSGSSSKSTSTSSKSTSSSGKNTTNTAQSKTTGKATATTKKSNSTLR